VWRVCVCALVCCTYSGCVFVESVVMEFLYVVRVENLC
jgi:hypothetical protein